MLPLKRQAVTAGCCHAPVAAAASERRGLWRLSSGAIGLCLWAVTPKCPLCLAAHLALWTGLGLSLTAAMWLRWSLLLASAVLLVHLVLNVCRRSAVGRRLRGAWVGPRHTAPGSSEVSVIGRGPEIS